MTEQLYRVCWRGYWPDGTAVASQSPFLREIGEAINSIVFAKKNDYLVAGQAARFDYWLEPVDE